MSKLKRQKEISTQTGIAIMMVFSIILFGGVFVYKYYSEKILNYQLLISDENSVALSLSSKTAITGWQTYTNSEYGFEVKLPDSWNGYSVEKQQWTGWAVSGNDIKYFGVKIIIKNPNTTQEQSWQDIPILLFSKDQWKLVTDEELAVSAAPIGPERIGENSTYVFATPPRWYGFTDAQGWQEAVEIVKTFKAF